MFAVLGRSAAAFCGHYVGSVGDELYNHASEVVIVRQDGRTTMTFENAFAGDARDFGLLIPIPVIVGEEDVKVVGESVIQRMRDYTAPRLVEYQCEDDWGGGWGGSGGGWSSGSWGSTTTTSTVEVIDLFLVGSYEIVILTAEQSSGLLAWLDTNGYATSASARGLLQEYIDGGSYFFAAKVALDAPGEGYLEPLQVGYDYAGFGLPIRLGTLNAGGCDQDLLLYFVTEATDGLVHVSNLPEVSIPDDCMWRTEDFATFDAFYEYQVATVMDGSKGPTWTVEYGWPSSSCDPCPTTPLDDDDVQALGYRGSASNSYTTRLHLRYDPDQVTQELLFHTTGTTPATQQRYIVHDRAYEGEYPICNRGWVQNPVDCDGAPVAPGGPGPYVDGPLPPPPPAETSCPLPPLDPPSGGGTPSPPATTGAASSSGGGKGCGCDGVRTGGAAGLLGLVALLRIRAARTRLGRPGR